MKPSPVRHLGERLRSAQFAGIALALTALVTAAWAGQAPPLLATVGKSLVERIWVPAPSSTRANDGLGPLFNARACVTCHAAAGAGRVVSDAQGRLADRGAVVRLATPQGRPDPVYGRQIQTRSVQNVPAEAIVTVAWDEHAVTLEDGSKVALRAPRLQLSELGYGDLARGTVSSLLLAPSLRIAGRIASVDHDGLRREAKVKTERTGSGVPVFGRKASEAALATAIAMAFHRDLGMSSARHPGPKGECTAAQAACRAGPHGDDGNIPEIAPDIIAAIAAYIEALAPRSAARPLADEPGAREFASAGCPSCHRPELPGTSGARVTLYSDLELHGMGPDLAGVSEDAAVPAQSWRTAPLIDIARRLASGSTLLHDGRARTIEEAILWHGGEARFARDAYAGLPKDARAALSRYVSSR